MIIHLTIIYGSGVFFSIVLGVMLMFTSYDMQSQKQGKQIFLTCLIWPVTGLAAIVRKLKEIE